jgi:hypothetical protein
MADPSCSGDDYESHDEGPFGCDGRKRGDHLAATRTLAVPMTVAMVIRRVNPSRVLPGKALVDRNRPAVGDLGGGTDRLLGGAGELAATVEGVHAGV